MVSSLRVRRRTIPALMRYWDELVSAGRVTVEDVLDAPIKETIRSIHARDNAAAIDLSFSTRLLDDLMQSYERAEVGREAAVRAHPVIETPRNPAPRASGWPAIRLLGQRQVLAALSAVVLLLLGIAVGGSIWLRSDPDQPAAVPAFVDPSAGGDLASTTLIDITFPAGGLGSGEEKVIFFSEVSMPPGSSLDVEYRCPPEEIIVYYVRSGTLTVNVVAESYILRAGESGWEAVAGGADARVEVGDVWLYEAHVDDDLTGVRNETTNDVIVLWSPVVGNPHECGLVRATAQIRQWYRAESGGFAGTGNAVRLRTRSISAAPGAEIPLYGDAGLVILDIAQRELGGRQWIHVDAGILEVVYLPLLPDDPSKPGVVRYDAKDEDTLTEELLFAPLQDMRMVLRSGGDEPLELTVLDVMVGGPEAEEGIPAP